MGNGTAQHSFCLVSIQKQDNCSKLNLGLCPSDPKRFGPIRRDIQSAIILTSNIEHRTSNVECGDRFAPSFDKKSYRPFLSSVMHCFKG